MERRKFTHLSWTNRLQIEAYLNAKVPIKRIAELLNVHISTIYREIKRGRYEHIDGSTWIIENRYSPDISEERYRNNLSCKGAQLKIGKDFELVDYIEKRIIKDKLTPSAVLGEIKHKNIKFKTSICINTLYSYIQKGVFLNLTLEHLPFGIKKKKHRRKVKCKKAPRGISIEQRPIEIHNRNTFGHWEMDCVCGPTKDTLLVLTERLTRKEIIFKINNQKSESVVRCLNILEKRYGKSFQKIFKSITVDNGTEFSDYKRMERSRYSKQQRVKIYYCHPYSAYERGSNERLNREIRRWFPKGTDFSKFTKSDIEKVEYWINEYPRKVLGYASSEELFQQQLLLIQ